MTCRQSGWAWLAESRLAGVPDDQLQAAVASNGYDPFAVTEALEALPQGGSHVAAQRATQRWKKLKSILDIRKSLASLAHGSGQIERRSSISGGEFLERYYAANKPVIFTDLLCNSFAYQYWTPDYLSHSCGDVTVEVMAGRHADPRYEMNCDAHRSSMRLADYVDMVLQGGSTNDYYLVAIMGFSRGPKLRRSFTNLRSYRSTLIIRMHSRGLSCGSGQPEL